jgi:hypothetical protein
MGMAKTADTAQPATAAPAPVKAKDEQLVALPILAYFDGTNLPEQLQKVTRGIDAVAWDMAALFPDAPDMLPGLRKLLQARDSFIRAAAGKG